MRSHPANSPQAAARIIALTVVDDGESNALVAAVEHWGLHHEMFRSSSRN